MFCTSESSICSVIQRKKPRFFDESQQFWHLGYSTQQILGNSFGESYVTLRKSGRSRKEEADQTKGCFHNK